MSDANIKDYTVLAPIAFGGRVEAGSVIQMTDEQAEAYLAAGKVEVVEVGESAAPEGEAETPTTDETAPETGADTTVAPEGETAPETAPEGESAAPEGEAETTGDAPGEAAV